MPQNANFGFRIAKVTEGWTWTTFDLAGNVAMRGDAPTKAVAAACVIRALARASEASAHPMPRAA